MMKVANDFLIKTVYNDPTILKVVENIVLSKGGKTHTKIADVIDHLNLNMALSCVQSTTTNEREKIVFMINCATRVNGSLMTRDQALALLTCYSLAGERLNDKSLKRIRYLAEGSDRMGAVPYFISFGSLMLKEAVKATSRVQTRYAVKPFEHTPELINKWKEEQELNEIDQFNMLKELVKSLDSDKRYDLHPRSMAKIMLALNNRG